MAAENAMANQFRKPAKRTPRTSVRDLLPINEVLLIASDGLLRRAIDRLGIADFGAKAYGLSCLPQEWVPPHFVVNGGVIGDSRLPGWIDLAIQESGLKGRVIVRSSGTSETMEHRGRLVSAVSSPSEIVQTIRALRELLKDDDPADVHWLIQEHVDPARKGHLSNERRMSYEPRDWVAEFELQGDFPGFTVPVPIRHWRVGDKVTDFDLDCTSEPGVTLKLKTVALWATGFSSRLHFEWVWSGTKLWIVQVDVAKAPEGVNPQSLFPATVPSLPCRCFERPPQPISQSLGSCEMRGPIRSSDISCRNFLFWMILRRFSQFSQEPSRLISQSICRK
jgi:hypothetical protein